MNAGSKFVIFFISLLISFTSKAHCPDTAPLFKRGYGFIAEGQYLLASQNFSLISAISCSQEEKNTATYLYATTLFQLEEPQAGQQILQELKASSISAPLAKRVRLLEAWYRGDLRAKLPEDEKKSFADFENAKAQIEQNEKIKSPWIAGTASALLPGLGQAYNQNYASALTSLVLNGLFLAAALEFQKNDLHAPALAAGVLFSITYTGSIFGSIDASKQINRAHQKPLIEEARKRYLPEIDL